MTFAKWGSGKALAFTLGISALALAAFACGDSGDDSKNNNGGDTTPSATSASGTSDYSKLSGSVTVDGSSTVAPVSEAVAEEFNKVSDVNVSVGTSGTGGGFEKFCRGETDINDASRPIKKDDEKEGKACGSNGVEYLELRVGVDGLTVVVNPENDFATCLTFSQLKKLWDQGSTVKKWSDLDASFPDDDIKLYGPGADSGTFDFFTEEVNGEVDQSRSDYTASEDDNTLVQGVENDGSALGYFGYAYFKEAGEGLKALQIQKDQNGKGTPTAAGSTCVAPTETTINDNSYPLSRPLFIYVSKKALAKDEVAGFVRYYLESAPDLVSEVGYVPLQAAEYEKGIQSLDASLASR